MSGCSNSGCMLSSSHQLLLRFESRWSLCSTKHAQAEQAKGRAKSSWNDAKGSAQATVDDAKDKFKSNFSDETRSKAEQTKREASKAADDAADSFRVRLQTYWLMFFARSLHMVLPVVWLTASSCSFCNHLRRDAV